MKTDRRLSRTVKGSARFFAMLLITLVIWLPVIVVIFTSLKNRSEIVSLNPRLIPEVFTLNNYIRLFRIMDFGTYLANSFIVASLTAVISLFVSSLAAFALVAFHFRWKKGFIAMNVMVYAFPQILLAIPLFLLCHRLGLWDRRTALVLTYLSFILPFAIWMLKNYFQTLSREMIDAGLLDGCSPFQALVRIVLPVARPAIATVLTYSFVLGWNEYMYANILIQSNSVRTGAIGVQTLIGSHGTDYGLLCAAAVVMILPVILFFVLIQKYFMDGSLLGGD